MSRAARSFVAIAAALALLAPLAGTQDASGAAGPVRVDEVHWQVAPGLSYSQWTEVSARGGTRVFLLTARLGQPGLVLDQVSGPTVSARAPLSRWLAADRAIAGVNADFFDINATGAPLGVGVDRQQSLVHAPRSGWNTTFLIDRRGNPQVVQDQLVSRLIPRGQPPITISNFNSPRVARGGIALYTPAWGLAPGPRVLGGTTGTRQVHVLNGKVVSNRQRLSARMRFSGMLLIGRGTAADSLSKLRVGKRVRLQTSLSVPAQMAVSGSVQLLHNGLATTRDNRGVHPRTAIGIDRDKRLLHLVVVDGRSENSGGKTLPQLARLLRSLGDEEGLNLDGGGSSTMVARDARGILAVRNRPSDGHERPIPNGLAFHYTAPRG